MATITIHKFEAEEIWNYILAHATKESPLAYEDLIQQFPKAMLLLPMMQSAHDDGVDVPDFKDLVVIKDRAWAESLKKTIAIQLGMGQSDFDFHLEDD